MTTTKSLLSVVSDSIARAVTDDVTDVATGNLTDAVSDAFARVDHEGDDEDKFQFTFVDGCQVRPILLCCAFIKRLTGKHYDWCRFLFDPQHLPKNRIRQVFNSLLQV